LIDLNALWVIKRLRAKNYEAYLTGGCVRDLLLGRTPKDFDVATNAKPEEVRQIFRNSRLIGRRFLLAHIFFPGNKIIETATFRANPLDVQEDLPEDLLVTHDNVYGNIEEDARRRDLTINGLFYDPIEGKVLDYVGGREDLQARLVRTIGDPDIRFQEDPVRILRALKFASRLGFQIEANTFEAMKKHVSEIPRCAPARLQEEFVRLLTSGHALEAFMLCKNLGLLEVFMPELTEDFLKMLQAIDAAVEREVDVSSAVAFSALLLPTYLALEKSEHNERNWIDKLCVNWAERIRLARHDQDKIRSILSVISNFTPAIVHKSWFRDALLLYTLYLHSEGQSLEPIGVLKAMARDLGKPYIQDKRGVFKPRSHFRRRRPQGRSRNHAA
jgi:poly(A) polymerase